MSLRVWRGDAPAVAQVTQVKILAVNTGDVFTLTINGKSISYTAESGDSINTVAAALVAAWNDSDLPEFAEVTAAQGTAADVGENTVILTADEDGKPFTVVAASSADGTNEVQEITIGNSPTGGTFTLTFDGQTTAGMAHNADGAAVQSALEALSNIDPGDVAVTGSAGGPYTATFGGQYADTNVPVLTADHSGLTGGTADVTIETVTDPVVNVNEVQTVTLHGATGGTFRLSVAGFESSDIAYNADAATVEAALEAVPTIGSGNVSVSGSAGGPYTVTFEGDLAAQDVELMEATSSLTAPSASVAETTEGVEANNSVERFFLSSDGQSSASFYLTSHTPHTSGTFTLTFKDIGGLTDPVTTDPIAYDATRTEVAQACTEALQAGGLSEAFVLNSTAGTVNGGGSSEFVFAGSLANAILGASVVSFDESNLTGGNWEFVFLDFGSGEGDAIQWEAKFRLTVGLESTDLLRVTSPFYGNDNQGEDKAEEIKSALESLDSVGANGADVSFLTSGSTPFILRVELTGKNAGKSVGIGTSTSESDEGIVGSWDLAEAIEAVGSVGSGQHEVQTLTLSGTPSAGTFRLSFLGEETDDLAYNISTNDLESALEGLSTIGTDGVSVSGTAGTEYMITFGGQWSYTNVALIQVDDTGLAIAVEETTPGVTGSNEVQRVTITGNPHGGTFTLTYDPSGTADTTAAIDYDATAAEVQTALEALYSGADNDFSVSGPDGGPWLVEFVGDLQGVDVEQMTAAATLHNGTVTVETTAEGGSLVEASTTTASSGPNHWDTAANWHDRAGGGAAVPVDGDDVVIERGSDILYGLDQSSVTLASLTIARSYTGRIGLAERRADGELEYLDTTLQIGATVIEIGDGAGQGSGRIKLDTGAAQTALTVVDTGGAIDPDQPPLLWRGTHAANTLIILAGSVGVALSPPETATIASLTQRGGTLVLGRGTTVGDVDKSGGDLTLDAVTVNGTWDVRG